MGKFDELLESTYSENNKALLKVLLKCSGHSANFDQIYKKAGNQDVWMGWGPLEDQGLLTGNQRSRRLSLTQKGVEEAKKLV